MTENDMKMWKLKMTPGMVKPQYLSFYLTKIQNQGQFWNLLVLRIVMMVIWQEIYMY